MARRYRYSFTKKKEAGKGKLSVGLAVASLVFFAAAVTLALILEGSFGFIIGSMSLFAALLSVYGFIVGLMSFSEEDCAHRTSIIGSMINGILMVGWLGFFLMGV